MYIYLHMYHAGVRVHHIWNQDRQCIALSLCPYDAPVTVTPQNLIQFKSFKYIQSHSIHLFKCPVLTAPTPVCVCVVVSVRVCVCVCLQCCS